MAAIWTSDLASMLMTSFISQRLKCQDEAIPKQRMQKAILKLH